MINRVVLVGRLTKDPELRYTQNGTAVANFILAANRPFKNQDGDRDADFNQVVVWRKQAENVANFLGKGSLAGIDGRIQTRSYENSDGKRVYITEVVADQVQFLEPRNASNFDNNPFDKYQAGNLSESSQKQNGGYSDPFANDPFGEKDDYPL